MDRRTATANPYTDLIIKLFDLRGLRVWQKFKRDDVSGISIGSSAALTITVKSSASKEWMPWDPTVDRATVDQQRRRAALMWKQKAGFGHLDMPYVEVSG
jgi:hypothetical protein